MSDNLREISSSISLIAKQINKSMIIIKHYLQAIIVRLLRGIASNYDLMTLFFVRAVFYVFPSMFGGQSD